MDGGSISSDRASSLIYHSGAIGDFVTTIPAFHAWRARHATDRIVLLGRPGIAALADGLGLFDEVWDAGSPRAAPLFSAGITPAPGQETRPSFDPVPALRLAAFSSALLFSPAASPLGANLARAGVRGIVRQDPFPSAGTWPADARPAVHVIDYHLSLFPDLGPDERRAPWLAPTGGGRTAADRGSTPWIPAHSGSMAALHPGSGSPRKNWPRARFEDAAGRLAARGFHVHWILGPAEEAYAPGDGAVLRGLPLPRIASFLSGCSLFVGNDSGIAHVAAAVRCPVVVLFGPTDPEVWAPRGGVVRVIKAGDGNMESITVGEVMSACEYVVSGVRG